MRRFLVLISVIAALVTGAVPVGAHDPTMPCAISVSPETGGRRDVYRITGRHFPRRVGGGSLEVHVDVLRVVYNDTGVHLKVQTAYAAALMPHTHTFYIDFNQEQDRIPRGHYIVAAETPHQEGCRAISSFDVTV